jgi:peptidase M42 family hydrolase
LKRIKVDTDYLRACVQELLAVPSPSGHTDNAVHWVCGKLRELSVEHEISRRGAIRANLYGRQSDPDRAVVAHLDTLGAMVKSYRPNGRLALVPIGTWSSRFAEGARATVMTDSGGRFRGTILPLKASGHVYDHEVDTQPVSWDHVELRLDERAESNDDMRRLGIAVGDHVAIDPATEFTDSGFIVSRHLDDKAGVACVLAAAKALREASADLVLDCHLLFTISEEVGSGASALLHQEVAEMVAVDNATPAPTQMSSEFEVNIPLMDSSGPFDYHLSRHLLKLAEDYKIPARRDVFVNYRSDAASAVDAGNDIRTALIGFGADAAHGWERTHIDGLRHVAELVAMYIQSPSSVERDRIDLGPITGFPHDEA